VADRDPHVVVAPLGAEEVAQHAGDENVGERGHAREDRDEPVRLGRSQVRGIVVTAAGGQRPGNCRQHSMRGKGASSQDTGVGCDAACSQPL
jgi:hypothetical protein